MYLTRPAEYALRATAYMARSNKGKRMRTQDLAKAVNVPPSFLAKIMSKLTENGILDAKKGHHGGFVLARPPSEILFIDVLRAVDYEPKGDHCLFGMGNCNPANPCPLHPEWGGLKAEIDRWARSHSLADSVAVAART